MPNSGGEKLRRASAYTVVGSRWWPGLSRASATVVGGLAWRRSSVWHGQAVVVAKSVFGGALEFLVAPANKAGESRRRQALPAVLATVVWCSGRWWQCSVRWSGALAKGLWLTIIDLVHAASFRSSR